MENSKSNNKLILGWWNGKARAEIIRILLEYLELKWEERTYDFTIKETLE